MIQEIIAGTYAGTIAIPASKSDVQRALLSAGLANGTSILQNIGESADEQQMLTTIQQLGAHAENLGNGTFQIKGWASFPSNSTIELGESGLGTRLITSVCAAHEGKFNLIGHGSLTTRPMTFFTDFLPKMGVKLSTSNGCVPMEVKGPIIAGKYSVDGSESSQYISGLMMGLPLINGDSEITVENLKSGPYLAMTLKTLESFGIQIKQKENAQFLISGNQKYTATEYTCEGDWSSAGYWLIAAALGQKISISGLSLESLQADILLLNALKKANCQVIHEGSTILVDGKNRLPLDFDATNCPDLFPTLATYAAFTPGISKIKGVSRLKHKESDRGTALKNEFAKLGVRIDIEGDVMFVYGQSHVQGGTIDSNNDHRIAMCFGIVGMFTSEPITVENASVVSKSYPRFWKDLEGLKK